MFNPKNYNYKIDIWSEKYRKVLSDSLLVMNSLKFTKTDMHNFKNGVRFNTIINNAKYSIDISDTKEMMAFINEGRHKRWSFARIYICDDGKIRCYLIERKQGKNEYTHYLTVRDNKIVLITL